MIFKKFRDQEFTIGWLELLIITVVLLVIILLSYIFGYRLGMRSGFDAAMSSAVSTLERMPLGDDYKKTPSLEDVSNVYARLAETGEEVQPSPAAEGLEAELQKEEKSKDDSTSAIDEKKSDMQLPESTEAFDKEIERLAEKGIKLTKEVDPGWYVQVAAPQYSKDAEDLAQKMRESGFAVLVNYVNVNGQEYFRVLSGPESTKVIANRLRDQLMREKLVDSVPFVREY
jgi:cell division septation protein DedD